jgi:general secretion pathway protein D
MKYGDARQIAKVLSDMFVGGSQSSLEGPDNQLAPGSGSTTASSADRLSLNGTSSSSSSGQLNGFGSRMSSGTGTGGTPGFGSSQPANGNPATAAAALDARSSGGTGQPLMQGVRITPDAVNNALLIYADQGNYQIIKATLDQCDQPQLQVAIDATIAEVTLTNELSYGVQAFLTSKNLGLHPDNGSILNTQSTQAPTTTTTGTASAAGTVTNAFLNRAFPGFNFLIGSEAQPSAILDALHTVTSVKVLSNPSLVVINNQTASLQVGDVVPVSTGSATVLTTSNTVVNTIDYRNTGIILRVSPRINANGNVRLEVEQEISSVSPTTAASLTPTVSERLVKSSISVAAGQTVLLAGLISEQQNGTRNGIPLLDEIQGLGDAFSHQDKKGTRTELIIFIRPQIIRDGTDAHNVAEELRSKLRGTVGASTDDLRVHTER